MSVLHEEIQQCSLGPVAQTASGYEKHYRFPPEFIGFQGHFPGNPVLPAIVQIMAACRALDERAGRRLTLLRVTRAKFVKVVAPGETVAIVWEEQKRDEGLLGKVKLMVGDTVASSFFLYLD